MPLSAAQTNANIPFNTQEEYYRDEDLHGIYQYVTLEDVINNFIINYTGDDKLINNVKRWTVVFHAKRGLQEINYDALKEIKAIELDIADTLTMIIPDDYVNYVRISWVDDCGRFHPMSENTNSIIAKTYLQDHEYSILFDSAGEGLRADSNTYDPSKLKDECMNYVREDECRNNSNGRFGLETGMANYNGWFVIDKRSGTIKFSSQVKGRSVVVEYISDGLEYREESEVMINKLAEESIYNYIKWMLLGNKLGVQEYIVRRAKKDYYNSLRIAKARLQNIRYDELVQPLRGKSKWIK